MTVNELIVEIINDQDLKTTFVSEKAEPHPASDYTKGKIYQYCSPTNGEKHILSGFEYHPNSSQLHLVLCAILEESAGMSKLPVSLKEEK